ncbi:mitochondrial ribosomal subunit protein-domain-containing protein [Nemania sp. FL0916]|nr:mitochondrial ribosomal subunit protein-domain-containing protein [Nemania sp. FL0916]
MASAVHSMRLCLRAASRRTAITARVRPLQDIPMRPFSSTRLRYQPAARQNDDDEPDDDDGDGDEDVLKGDVLDEDIEEQMERAMEEYRKDPDLQQLEGTVERAIERAGASAADVVREPWTRSNQLYFDDDETDPDLKGIADEPNDENPGSGDMMFSMAHAKLEEFREYREYARIAAWQMPLLSKLATRFEAPTAQEPLRFRYTSYMGEFHPAESKVVVEFSPQDLPLEEAQMVKLRKLLGPRWNPETDIAKMSCELYEHPAQNKRHLADLVNKLVVQAKDPTDMFEDIPLDTRHHTFKVKPRFPKEWRMTDERRKSIDDARLEAKALDQKKEKLGALVDGQQKIEMFFYPNRFKARVRAAQPEMAHVRAGGRYSEFPLRAPPPIVRR